ncbi:hypothetical protein AOXY_G38463 [Acipenser oxyrinchus oxyrinchus]|uniref:Uncharacterized protein n=1 Tax=Acipenser oxyrinchus oxyrinchus TaxID=40147 RepID=A0AAD8FQ51_ACIOX|nr:hypothetical protein AOXY_G38463 [Acipenser oxyrinchus oxyrinchus]
MKKPSFIKPFSDPHTATAVGTTARLLHQGTVPSQTVQTALQGCIKRHCGREDYPGRTVAIAVLQDGGGGQHSNH